MPQLALTAVEAELLREIMEEWLSDLRMEIAATDRSEYRQALKAKESVARELLARLEVPIS